MKTILPLFLLALLAGCVNPLATVHEPGQVQHVVVCWLKPGVDRAALTKSVYELDQIPGMIDVSVADKLASDRPTVDSSYDLLFVMTFKDEAALRAYNDHPIHQKLTETVLKPNVSKLQIYDARVSDLTLGEELAADLAKRRREAYEQQRDIVDRAH